MVIKDKNPLKNKNTIILLAVLLVVLGALAYYQFVYKNRNNSSTISTSPSEPEKKINYGPPTEADKNQVDSNKEAIVKKDESTNTTTDTPSTTPTTKKSVKPVITYAGVYGDNIEVGSYVNDVYEDGGTCTATFSLGSATFTKSVSAVKNVSNMSCPVIQVPKSQFNPMGNWTVKVSYDSANANGTSDNKIIEVK
jgi:cytoskeletal protein RodZ